MGSQLAENKNVSFHFSDEEMDTEHSWVNYDKCSEKAVEALSRNRRIRKHFSVIEVNDLEIDEYGSQGRKRAMTFFKNPNKHSRKSLELKVIESTEDEDSFTTSKDDYITNINGIWGLHSHKVDIKNLHPEVGELLQAASDGNNEKINDILKDQACMRITSKADFNVTDTWGRSALHLAVYNNHLHTAKLLINQGATVDFWDSQKLATPLMCAAAIGKISLIELLLANGADVNFGYDRGVTALLWATRSGSVECIQNLLEAGAKQNAPMMYSETPLHVSCSRGDIKCMTLLLQKGADVHLKQGDVRNTPLHLSAKEFSTECCELLLDYGAKIDAQNAQGETALHIAVLSCDGETTRLLLSRGADVSVRNLEERTPLFYAIDKDPRAIECMEALLTHNADVNCQDRLGVSPLHICALKESKRCAALLIKHNANVAIVSKAGVSALSLMLRKIPDTMQFIRNHLNDGVTVVRDTNDSSCKVKLNFRTIVPSGGIVRPIRSPSLNRQRNSGHNKETEVIKCFIRAGQQNILLHPLIEAFLTLKWQKMRKFFYIGIVLKVLLAFLFSVVLVKLYVIKETPRQTQSSPALSSSKVNTEPDPNENKTIFIHTPDDSNDSGSNLDVISYNDFIANVSSRSLDNDTQQTTTEGRAKTIEQPKEICLHCTEWMVILFLIVGLSLLLIFQELIQMMQSFKTYILYIESWIFWLFIIHVCFTCTFLPRDGNLFVKIPWQQSFSAVSIFLAWIFILVQLGKFPTAGTLVQMFVKVFVNFGRFFAAYSCFLMAFALAFCILFSEEEQFANPLLAFAKVIRIMTGDVNQEVYYTKIKSEGHSWIAHIFHFIFIVMVTIVLMNLLVGLAVADIQGMYRHARLHRLSRQAALVYHLESSFLSSAVLKRIPISCAAFLKRHILVLPFCLNDSFIIRPYDYRDIRLPEYLKLSFLKLSNSSAGEMGYMGTTMRENESSSDLLNSNSNYTYSNYNCNKDLEQKVADMKNQLDYLIEKMDKYYSVSTSHQAMKQ